MYTNDIIYGHFSLPRLTPKNGVNGGVHTVEGGERGTYSYVKILVPLSLILF